MIQFTERIDLIFTIYIEKYIIQNNHSLDSLNASLGQLQKTYEAVLVKLKQFYDENTKQVNDFIKVYRKYVIE